MEYRVDITDPALSDAGDYVVFIREIKKQPRAAERWFRGLVQAIYSLEKLPERCPLIPERKEFGFEIRHLLYYSHRIIFGIDTKARSVTVFRIYHSARKPFSGRDLL